MKELILLLVCLSLSLQATLADEVFKYKANGEFRSLYFDDLDDEIKKALQNKHDVRNISYLVSLLETNTGFLFSDRRDVNWHIRAIPAIVENYGKEILPYLLDYALRSDKAYLQQRAVYTIEEITQLPIENYIEELLGENAVNGKFTAFIWNGDDRHSLNRFFPPTGPDTDYLVLKSRFETLPIEEKSVEGLTIENFLDDFNDQVEVCSVLGLHSSGFEHYIKRRGFPIMSPGGDSIHSFTINKKYKEEVLKLIKSKEVMDKFRIAEIHE